MTVKMVYGASTFEPSRDPVVGGFGQTRMWKSPSMRSGGGKLFVFDKAVKADLVTLTWKPIDPTDLTSLITFLDAVDANALLSPIRRGILQQRLTFGVRIR